MQENRREELLGERVASFVDEITRGPFKCLHGYDGEVWSAIDDVAKYYRIVDGAREGLQGKVVLEEEFSIWAAEKARFEREDVRKAVFKVAAYDGCPEELKEQLVSYAELLTK